ncbi:hypothetical protein ScPMuIL_009370 [Solemya velum]
MRSVTIIGDAYQTCLDYVGEKTNQCIFSEQMEKDLVDYIIKMESMMFGLSTTDVRSLAFQKASANGLTNQFNEEKKKAGKD